MRQTYLGSTDLKVSAIAFGTWAFGGDWGAVDVEESTAVIHRALELGITLFDTARGYGFGVAERLLGNALRHRVQREDIVIATKGGLRMDGDTLIRDATARRLREGVESSLRSLDTGYIDLLRIHWPDLRTPAEETAEGLEQLVGEGKVGYVGVSNYNVEQVEVLRTLGWLDTRQPPYHMFHRDIEDEILPYTRKHDIGVLVYGPLAHGLLGGRLTAHTTFAADLGVSLPALAVSWTQTRPAVDVTIVGAHRPARLDDTAAADRPLSERDLIDIDLILADSGPMRGPRPEGM
jgi:aryl-alcohol dehydrogenase-like predicted oxidoreductase